MIYLFTAAYCEAAPLIGRYRMKKDARQVRFQVFDSEEEGVRLVITGSGMLAAAAALASVFTAYGAGRDDFYLNIGICAGSAGEAGKMFLCSKITDGTTGRTFYPDLLYRHPFAEAQVQTEAVPVTGEQIMRRERLDEDFGFGEPEPSGEVSGGERKNRRQEEILLYDMEAAALYQAGSYFFGPHQAGFLKVVSDAGREQPVSPKKASALIESHAGPVAEYIARLLAAGRFECRRGAVKEEDEEFLRLSQEFCCTRAMSESLARLTGYCGLAGIDYAGVARSMREEGYLPCGNKREGSVCLEEFKRRLL